MRRPETIGSLYRQLLSYVVPYWRIFAIAILSIVILAMTEPAIPALMKPLLDGSFVEKDPETIKLMPFLLVLLFLVRGLSGYISTVALSWVSGKVVMDIRNDMFNHLMVLPTTYFDDNASGTIISKLTFNVGQVAQAATNSLLVLVRDSVSVIGLLAWMIYINWQLTLIFLLVVPIIGLIVLVVSGRLRRLSRLLQTAMGSMTQILGESIKGNRVVKLFGGEEYEKNRFFRISNHARHMSMKIVMTSAANVPIVQMVAVIALASIIFIASSQELGNEFTVGSFMSFFGAMGLLFSPIKRLTKVNEELQRGLAASESIFDLLSELSEPDKGTHTLTDTRGRIRFQNVSLRYNENGRPALDDINLDIQPGETVALVGKSGSGKTSIAALIPRFYQPTNGEIWLDDTRLEDIPLGELRNNIALVSQDVVLFNDTVAANIAYGATQNTSEAEIISAAEAAHAMEFINDLPEGLQTLIGEDGARLSGGQRQRLAIARALLKNAPILILDEATSALDTTSERHIQDALEQLMKGRTSIVIAHRLSTIEQADRIVVLKEGHIIETGSHRELLDLGGTYWQLYNSQKIGH